MRQLDRVTDDMRRISGSPGLSKHSRWAPTVAVVLVTVFVAACAAGNIGGDASSVSLADPLATDASSQKRIKPTRIAMLLPLGGFDQTAAVAKSMKQAAEMALFELDNPSVQLVVKDDKGTAEGAKAAAEEAIRDGAEIILGPLFAKAVPGAATAARAANVPIVSFSNDTAVAGNGVYLMSFLPKPEVDRIVSYAASQGKRQFAALIPDDAFGRSVEPAFRAAVARSGGVIAQLEFYPVRANGMLEPAKQILEAIKQGEQSGTPIDALFLPGGQDVLPQLGPLIAYQGIDTTRVKLLGTGAWDFPNIGRDQAFVGGWYPSPDPRGWRDFSERFAKTFGVAPPRVASLAYDAVGFAVSLSPGPPGARFSAASLSRPDGYNGIDGQVNFGAGGLSQRGLAVLEVQKFGANVIDPASGGQPGGQLSAAGARFN